MSSRTFWWLVCVLALLSLLLMDTEVLAESTIGVSPDQRGRNAAEFITQDGKFDMNLIASSEYRGPLQLDGSVVEIDQSTGEPIVYQANRVSSNSLPDDTYWSPLGTGTDNQVLAFAIFDHKLIIGGGFSSAAGLPAPNSQPHRALGKWPGRVGR